MSYQRLQMEPISPVRKVWKPELYKIQLEAPTPKAILRNHEINDAPEFYGYEFHGEIGHLEVGKILHDKPDGSYLIRISPGATDFYTLSVRFNEKTKHYKIYYKPNEGHYLRENFKRYETIHDLVADGLVLRYMEIHAAPIIKEMMSQTTETFYQQSPYMTLNRRKLRVLSNDIRKSIQRNENFDSEIETALLDNNNEKKKNVSILTAAAAAAVNTSSIKLKDILTSQDNDIKTTANSSDKRIEDEEDSSEILPVIYEKSHAFKLHTFKGLNWCEFCANFLWGFTAQGVKCEDCGFMAHQKCSELVPPKCVPDLKRIRGVFGTDLTTLVTAHQCTIPFVIKRCVEEVECRGMLQEGIYRVSGFADEIEALKLALDRDGEKTDMSEAAYSNINVIAGTLKLYLRLLPIPLITFQSYPAFMRATKSRTISEQIKTLKNAVKQLPQAHYNCLKFMVEHLNRVSSHYAVNKMNEHNLATVFAPTLIATPQHLTDLSQEIFMLSSLINNCQAIFG